MHFRLSMTKPYLIECRPLAHVYRRNHRMQKLSNCSAHVQPNDASCHDITTNRRPAVGHIRPKVSTGCHAVGSVAVPSSTPASGSTKTPLAAASHDCPLSGVAHGITQMRQFPNLRRRVAGMPVRATLATLGEERPVVGLPIATPEARSIAKIPTMYTDTL